MGQLKHKYSKETWLFMEFGTSNLFKAIPRPATQIFFFLKEKKKYTHFHPTIVLRSSVIQIKLPPQQGCESKNKKSM